MSTPQKEVMINQQRDNLARLQMFNPLPYRLLPILMNVQSEREQIVEKSAASNFGNILMCSSKTDVRFFVRTIPKTASLNRAQNLTEAATQSNER